MENFLYLLITAYRLLFKIGKLCSIPKYSNIVPRKYHFAFSGKLFLKESCEKPKANKRYASSVFVLIHFLAQQMFAEVVKYSCSTQHSACWCLLRKVAA